MKSPFTASIALAFSLLAASTIALTLRLSGNNVNSILLNRSGLPTTPNQVYGYTLSLGGPANDVSGTLL